LIRPPAMAVAILPEPIKPTLSVDILLLSFTITFYTDLSFCFLLLLMKEMSLTVLAIRHRLTNLTSILRLKSRLNFYLKRSTKRYCHFSANCTQQNHSDIEW
jgi:hypothetical protein